MSLLDVVEDVIIYFNKTDYDDKALYTINIIWCS